MLKFLFLFTLSFLFMPVQVFAVTEEEINQELHKLGSNASIKSYYNDVLILNKNNKLGILKYQGVEDNTALSSINFEYDDIEKVNIKPTADNVEHFFYKTKKNNKYGAVDRYGNFVTLPIYDDVKLNCEQKEKYFQSEIFIVKLGGKYGGYTRQQNFYTLSVPVQFDDVELLAEESWDYYILVMQNSKKGLYIATGRTQYPTILPTVFDEITFSQNPYVAVKQYGKYGVYFWGRQVVPIKYDKVEPVGHYIIVTLNNQQGVYHEGNVVVPISYDEVQRAENSVVTHYADGAKFIVKRNNKYGIYDIAPVEFDNIQEVYRGFIVKQNGKYGLYHLTKGKLLNPEYDRIYMQDNTAVCEKNGRLVKNIDMSAQSGKEKTDEMFIKTIFAPLFWATKGMP